jgi:hypothetical protein
MPKTEIDYSNTVIYKITCKNKAVKDVYVGHTTNFVQRKHAHKQNCINIKASNSQCKLYEMIRENGGWANWRMEIITFYNCADHYAAQKKEQEYFIALNATLNSIDPLPKVLLKPIKPQTTSGPLKTAHPFHCEKCHFGCSKQSNFTKHLATNKHQTTTSYNTAEMPPSPAQSINKGKAYQGKAYQCECGKIYNHRASLFNHKKKCTYELAPLPEKKPKLYEKEDIVDVLIKENMDFKNIILEVVKNNAELQKQNQEYQKQMMELYKKGSNTVIANNNNKTFNLQVFLNEQCKDAMNIMDFVNSMTLELSDLEDVGKNGYVEGISHIIIKKLNELDIYKRPIHCSDAKREIMYVKDDNIWEKENNTYDKLRKAVKYVTYKNSALLVPWSQKYPACMNNQHHLNDVYIQLMGQAMGGKGEFVDSENKIMKKIAKAVLIDVKK